MLKKFRFTYSLPKLGDELTFAAAIIIGCPFNIQGLPDVFRWMGGLRYWDAKKAEWVFTDISTKWLEKRVTVANYPLGGQIWRLSNYKDATSYMKEHYGKVCAQVKAKADDDWIDCCFLDGEIMTADYTPLSEIIDESTIPDCRWCIRDIYE